MKKIAFITINEWMPWGGSEELWSQTALRMAGEDFVVGVSVVKWGIKELVEDNVNGFLAKAPTVELIDEAMERAWQRKDEWEEMGKLATEKVRKLIPADPVKIFSDQLKELLSCRGKCALMWYGKNYERKQE